MRHSFDPGIAAQVGVNAAVIYQNIVYWTEKNAANGKHEYEGRYWTYNSISAFKELFPYLSESQIRTALGKLEDVGLIVSGTFNKMGADRTKWYSPCSIICEKSQMDCEKSQIHLSEIANPSAKNHKPIPDTKPNNKPDGDAPTPASRFEEAWALYPAGQGRNCGKPEACRAYLGQVRAGADEADLVEAVRAYVATKPECVTRFDKLMRSEAWREYLPKRASPDDEREAWRIKLAMWARNGRWPSAWGPDPESPLCKAPPDLIAAAQEAAA